MKINKELYIFDENLELLSNIALDNKVELDWYERFFENDAVKITIQYDLATDTKSQKYQNNKNLFESLLSMYKVEEDKHYIYPRFIASSIFDENNLRIAYIENFEIDEDERKIEINAVGFLGLLNYRNAITKEYIPSEVTSDTVGEVVCRVTNFYTSVDPVLSKIFIADETVNVVGDDVYFRTEDGDSVYEKILELMQSYELGFSTNFNRNTKQVELKIIDVSNDIPEIAVSKDDSNLSSNVYGLDISNFRNYITASSSYETDDDSEDKLIIESVDNTNGCIIFSTTTDIDSYQGELTELEYREVVKSEADKELKLNTVEEDFDIDILDSVNLSIGEKAVVKIRLGYKYFIKETKVTEIQHNVKNANWTKKLTFDKPHNSKKELKKILGV